MLWQFRASAYLLSRRISCATLRGAVPLQERSITNCQHADCGSSLPESGACSAYPAGEAEIALYAFCDLEYAVVIKTDEFSRSVCLHSAAAAGRWRHCYDDDDDAPSGECRLIWRHEAMFTFCRWHSGICLNRWNVISVRNRASDKGRTADVAASLVTQWRIG